MNIKKYLYTLVKQRSEGNTSPELARRIAYARAYMQGEEGLKRYRDRAISTEIGKTYDKDAQLALLFNKETEPVEYATYQAFRTECKAKVDAEIRLLRAELEAEIETEVIL